MLRIPRRPALLGIILVVTLCGTAQPAEKTEALACRE